MDINSSTLNTNHYATGATGSIVRREDAKSWMLSVKIIIFSPTEAMILVSMTTRIYNLIV